MVRRWRRALPRNQRDSGGEYEDYGAEQWRPGTVRALGIQQTTDSFHKIPSCSSYGRFWAGPTVFFQYGQRRGVGVRVAVQGHHHIVTAVFALGANHTGHPSHRRVIKQQAFHDPLQ